MKTLFCFIKYIGFGNKRFVDIEDSLFGFDKNSLLLKANDKINKFNSENVFNKGILYWEEGEYIFGQINVEEDKGWTIYYENIDSGSTFFIDKNGINSHIPIIFKSRNEAEQIAINVKDLAYKNNVNVQFLLYPIKVNVK